MTNEAQTQCLDEGQLVTFRMGGEELALPLGLIQEIVRPPAITQVPGAPGYIMGIANLRGSILPVMDLRLRLSVEKREQDEDTRVVVLDCAGRSTGIIVDSVSEVMHTEGAIIEEPPAVIAGVDGQYLRGVVKADEGKRLVMILSTDMLIPELLKSQGDTTQDVTRTTSGRRETVVEEEELLVTFHLGEEEFALDIMQVQEIIRVVGITNVPKAPAYIRGVMTLRNRLLPIIDLRRRFAMPTLEEETEALAAARAAAESGEASETTDALLETADEVAGAENCQQDETLGSARAMIDAAQDTENPEEEELDARRIVVVSIGGMVCGLQVDSVSEVLRMPTSQMEPPPTMLESHAAVKLNGVGKLDNGERLLMFLDASSLLSDEEQKELSVVAKGAHADGQDDASREEVFDESQMVCFLVGEEEFGLDIMQVREIIRIDDITEVPQAPSFVEGIVNLRGQILPVIDMRARFGLPRVERSEQNRIMVVTIQDRTTGIIVDSVSEVIRIQNRQLEEPPSVLSSNIDERFLVNIAKLNDGKRIIMALNVDAFLSTDERAEFLSMGQDKKSARKADKPAEKSVNEPSVSMADLLPDDVAPAPQEKTVGASGEVNPGDDATRKTSAKKKK